MRRKTKIICTIGPASEAPEVLDRLIEAGMDAARINFSHGTKDQHLKMYESIRAAAVRAGVALPVIGDLQGPRIRIGRIGGTGSVELIPGSRITLTSEENPSGPGRIGTTYRFLAKDVKPGDMVLINDGLLRLEVEKTEGEDVLCLIHEGGTLTSHKGMNLPGVAISEPALTEKDLEDFRFLIETGFDYVALSFVMRSEDVAGAKKILAEAGSEMQVLAKIEKPEALEDLDAIIGEADGILVARGDLGVELGVERVPAAQKRMLREGGQKHVLTITATQMLESMIENPVPTRAEATDVANAVFDGTDALLFTGETAAGKHPVEVVSTADRIVREAEGAIEEWGDPSRRRRGSAAKNFPEAICHSTFQAASDLGASAIVIGTQTGRTALVMSKFRPPMPVVGISADEAAVRRMSLYHGVYPAQLPRMDEIGESIRLATDHLLKTGLAKAGETVAMTFGEPLQGKGLTNMMRLVKIGK
ncbi:MAG: pyruvate kinase [Gemmatimonadota bacterium]|nr:pyruvate kinase [Gemmatimonadota bacterium]